MLFNFVFTFGSNFRLSMYPRPPTHPNQFFITVVCNLSHGRPNDTFVRRKWLLKRQASFVGVMKLVAFMPSVIRDITKVNLYTSRKITTDGIQINTFVDRSYKSLRIPSSSKYRFSHVCTKSLVCNQVTVFTAGMYVWV